MKIINAGAAFMLCCTGLFSCSDQYTICTLSKTVNLQAGFYHYHSGAVTAAVASSLTITPLIGQATAYHGYPDAPFFLLHLDPAADSVVYRVKVSGASEADTLTLIYNTHEYNLSFECGAINTHTLLRSYSTNHTIDSVATVNAEVTNNVTENIRIFF
jgi:hypothetical protein